MIIFAHIFNIYPRSIKLLMRINTYVYTSFSYKVNYADYVNKHINYASKTYFPTFVIIGIPIELFEILELIEFI